MFVDMIIVTLQVALSAILGVAAIGKFLDQAGSLDAVTGFGVPQRWSAPVARALPVVELMLAVLILPAVTARWSALAATALMLVFAGAIAWNLRLGRQPDCHCFGQFHSSPASTLTIVRNGGFALMAAIVAWHGSPGPVTWFSGLSELSQIVVLFGVVALGLLSAQVWLSWQIWSRNRLMTEMMDDGTGALPVIDETLSRGKIPFRTRSAPPFDLATADGRGLTLRKLLSRGKPVLLLFVDPKCGPCRQLVPDIHEWHRRFGDELRVVLVSRGDVATNLEKFGDLTILMQQDQEILDLYDIDGTPTGVLVSRDGLIREPYAPGRAEIRELVMRAMRGKESPKKGKEENGNGRSDLSGDFPVRLPKAAEQGTAGTRLPLPDLDGRYVGLDDFRGQRVILLFFNPTCVFCQQMAPDLREWETEAANAGTRLLIVSTGTVEDNRRPGLQSQIVLDDSFLTGRDYGAPGTPSAIVLDEAGNVASAIASGPDAVIDLLYEELEAGIPA